MNFILVHEPLRDWIAVRRELYDDIQLSLLATASCSVDSASAVFSQ